MAHNFIRQWREHRNLTQDQLAESIGTTAQQVSRLERGERRLSDKWLRALTSALGCTETDLMNVPPPTANEAGSADEAGATPVEHIIVQLLREISRNQQHQLENQKSQTEALARLADAVEGLAGKLDSSPSARKRQV